MSGPYSPMDPGSSVALPMYIFIMAFSWFMTIILFIRWRERKKTPPKLLFITFLSYSICITVLTIGFIDVLVSGFKRELYQFSLAFGYAGIMISNIFLILFAADIFTIKSQFYKKYIIISLIIAVSLALPWNYYGLTRDLQPTSWTIRPYTQGGMMLFSIVTYIRIYMAAMRIHNIAEERLAKVGFKLIAYSQIGMIIFFVSLFADMVYFSLSETITGFTIFFYIAWVFAGLFFVLSYFGLIMPEKLKQRLIQEDKTK